MVTRLGTVVLSAGLLLAPVSAQGREPPPPPPSHKLRSAFVGLAGGTVMATMATVAFGVLTVRSKRAYEDAVCDNPCEEEHVRAYRADVRDEFYRHRTVTNVGIGLTSAFVIATTTVGILWARAHRAETSKYLRASVGPGSLTLRF